MSRLISISDPVDQKLLEIKGKASYSKAIALLMNQCEIKLPDNLPRLPSNSTASRPVKDDQHD
jgi:hypothetical protein